MADAHTIDVTYLLNSGFLVHVDDVLLIFDDFDDPAGVVPQALKKGGYILSADIRSVPGASRIPQDKVVWMPIYDAWQDDTIAVTSFSSTDEGTSFLVETRGRRIFHAGDFNWWDWLGDTAENRKLAENGFRKQMKRLKGLSFDLAFFPVDGRLEASMDRGAKEFCAETNPGALVTMHSVGYPAWQPPANFFAPGREIPVWSPRISGEMQSF